MTAAARRIAMALVVFALASAAWADVPWKRGDEAVTPATLEEIKADVGQAQYERIVNPIESKVDLAKKAMEPYDKEMEKPADKRRASLLQKCKVRSAQMYEAAAKAGQRACHVLQKKSHQAGIEEAFVKPNRAEAVRIYMELSNDAHAAGSIPQAAVFCRKALEVDPQNEQARELLKQLAEEYRQAVRDGRTPPGTGSGGDDEKKPWEWDRNSTHNRDWGDWRNYSGGAGRRW